MDDQSVTDRLMKCDASTIEKFSFAKQSFYARVLDVYDADSLRITVQINNKLCYVMTRLIGIDTAEIASKNPTEQARAIAARNFALSWVLQKPVGPNITKKQIKDLLAETPAIVFVKCRDNDKFGRALIDVYRKRDDPEPSLNQRLLDSGHAVKYVGDQKTHDWSSP